MSQGSSLETTEVNHRQKILIQPGKKSFSLTLKHCVSIIIIIVITYLFICLLNRLSGNNWLYNVFFPSKSFSIILHGLVCMTCVTVTACLSDLGDMKLSLDSMSALKIVLFIFEAFLLTDCARGESCFLSVLFLKLILCFLNLDGENSL